MPFKKPAATPAPVAAKKASAKMTMNVTTGKIKVTPAATPAPAPAKKAAPAPAKKTAAKPAATPAPAPAPAKAEPKAKGPQLPMVYRDGTHSAIVLAIDDKAVTLITMASMKLEEMRRAEFDSTFFPYEEYPVRRCAEIYLGCMQYREIDEQTRNALFTITGGKMPASATKTFQQQQQPKEIDMPKVTEGKKPAHPLRRASDANIRQAMAAAGVKSESPTAAKGDKPSPAKETKPTPAKKVAAKAPAKSTEKPSAKAAPAAKTAAKTATPPVRTAKFPPETKCKMGDTAKAKRGKMLTYIEKAIELAKKSKGQTTRGAIDTALAGSWEGDDLNTYFPYAVKNGLLVAG